MKYRKLLFIPVFVITAAYILFLYTGETITKKTESDSLVITATARQVFPLFPVYMVHANLHYKGEEKTSMIARKPMLSIFVRDPEGKLIESPGPSNDPAYPQQISPGEDFHNIQFFFALHQGEYMVKVDWGISSVKGDPLFRKLKRPLAFQIPVK
ncbi:MAG: hypothetical protein H0Z32_14975 [Bacillaceae bacterium]|nr:hypothetical protein [Bacillaceae bacterium]